MSKHDQSIETDESKIAFESLLPEKPAQLNTKPHRITITKASKSDVVAEAPSNWFHNAIFKALAASFQTPWFSGLAPKSQQMHFEATRRFFDWINKFLYVTGENNRYECLKDFEAHRMNVDGVKHSPLRYIRSATQKGLNTNNLSDEECHYLRSLLRLTRLPKAPDSQPFTLTDWFELPWLRSVLGERHYLSLESPARLFNSFRVTVATTLIYLFEIRERWKQLPSPAVDLTDDRKWLLDWNPHLLKQIASFNTTGEPTDDITELLCLDIIDDKQWPMLKKLLAERGKSAICKKPIFFGKQLNLWRHPVFFRPENLLAYSKIEELLMAWLVACEAVQPMDIPKLHTTDYACEYNSSGRLIAMQCSYYKGRAGAIREPAMLIASDCWTKAQHAYISGLSHAAPLFQHAIGRALVLPDFSDNSNFSNSALSRIFKLWQLPDLQKRIRSAVKRADVMPIFLDAILALEQGSQSQNRFQYQNKGASRADYKASVSRPLPGHCFSLTHIKTTAVHAQSDRYRESDLINHHSHSSATEKHHYLTDSNKDFVNRAGRITRVVLHDLQNVIYQPSVSKLTQSVNDLELRSRVVEATESTDAQIHPFNLPANNSVTDDFILVPDTVEQALIFVHSITQAEENYKELLNLRPDWVQRTLLPHLEWMSRTLSRMKSAIEAQRQYSDLKLHLPAMYSHMLETQE